MSYQADIKYVFISDDVNISAVKLCEISDDQRNIFNCKCSTASGTTKCDDVID